MKVSLERKRRRNITLKSHRAAKVKFRKRVRGTFMRALWNESFSREKAQKKHHSLEPSRSEGEVSKARERNFHESPLE